MLDHQIHHWPADELTAYPPNERRYTVFGQSNAERIESKKAIAEQLKKYQALANFEAIKARALAKQAKRNPSQAVAA